MKGCLCHPATQETDEDGAQGGTDTGVGTYIQQAFNVFLWCAVGITLGPFMDLVSSKGEETMNK